jgi:hypothetical protein
MVQAEFGWRRLAGLFDDLFAAPARAFLHRMIRHGGAPPPPLKNPGDVKKRRRFDAVLPAPKGVEERHNALGAIGSARRSTTTACRRPARRCAPATSIEVLVWCKGGCQHQAPADLQKLIDSGRGDTPLIHLRYRCSKCGSSHTDWVVTSRYGGRPAWNTPASRR